MFSKNKLINFILTIIAIITSASFIILIALACDVKIDAQSKSGWALNYETNEENENNTWNISATEDDNVIATLSKDGTLTISGTGKMKDWKTFNETEWHDEEEKIKVRKVIIQEGITNIGNNAFDEHYGLISVKIPNSVTNLGTYAFNKCINLTNIEIPKGVISIENSTFNGCTSLENIKVNSNNSRYYDDDGVLYTKDKTTMIRYPEGKKQEEYKILRSVTKLEVGSFYGCKSLTIVELPNLLTCIEWKTFKDCVNLKNVKIPEGITTVGECAFEGCTSLSSIQLPNSITQLGPNAFNSSGLESIEIPKNVTSISESAFNWCDNLNNITVDANNSKYCDVNGVLYSKDKTCIIRYPEAKEQSQYIIPNTVIKIEENAFQRASNLENIEIPETVTSIGSAAFFDCCNLLNIEIPNGIIMIPSMMVYECENLRNIEIPQSVTTIGDSAFYGCTNLTSLEIPNAVTNIGDLSVFTTKIVNFLEEGNSIELPNIFKRIQNPDDMLYSDEGLWLLGCTIDGNTIKLNERSSNATIEVKSGILEGLDLYITYNSWDISEKNDGSITAKLSTDGILDITGIGTIKNTFTSSVFSDVSEQIRTVNISEGITNIGDNLFGKCSNLTRIEIPSTVTSIGDNSFYMCKKLKCIDIPNNTTSIGESAFLNCNSLTSIEIPYKVTSIEFGTFMGCRSLMSIQIPANVNSIGEYAFEYCSNLTEIIVSSDNINYCDVDGVLFSKDKTEIIKYPAAKEETEYSILSNVTKICTRAFSECANIEKIQIPDGVNTIKEEAFYECKNLTDINLPPLLTSIEDGMFANCSSLTSVIIPNNVTSIGLMAFDRCESLTNIRIPKDVTNIEAWAFSDCYKLRNIEIQSVAATIYESATENCYVLTILCHKDSTAERYAIDNEIRYQIIGQSDILISSSSEQIIDEDNLILKIIKPGLTSEEIRANLINEIEYEIIDKNGDIISESKNIGTGSKIKMSNDKIYTIIVLGDCNGDAKSDIMDIFEINKHRLNKVSLLNEFLLAGDVTGDGKSNLDDIFKINKFRLNRIDKF